MLYCGGNQIVTLDVSKNIALTELHCGDNKLQSLKMKNGNNTKLKYFNAKQNYDLRCIEVDNVIWAAKNLKEVDAVVFFKENCK
jgi:Leucine-rich repeat (LRR) protein